MSTTGNRRLDAVLRKAVEMDLGGGQYLLDGYNNDVLCKGISFAITTRTFGDNNHFLMEVYEETDTDKHDR